MCHEKRFELNIASLLHLKMKAREHKCVNDCCYGEQESYWMAPLPPSSLPSELSFCLFRLCTVSHTDVIPHAGKAKFGRSVTLSIFGIWGFFEIWGLVALYTFEYRSSSFNVVLPPPHPPMTCYVTQVMSFPSVTPEWYHFLEVFSLPLPAPY